MLHWPPSRSRRIFAALFAALAVTAVVSRGVPERHHVLLVLVSLWALSLTFRSRWLFVGLGLSIALLFTYRGVVNYSTSGPAYAYYELILAVVWFFGAWRVYSSREPLPPRG